MTGEDWSWPSDPTGRRPSSLAAAASQSLEKRWQAASRYDRRARLTRATRLTPTGTVNLAFEVSDPEPFAFEPGQFVGIGAHVGGRSYRRSPYCILSPPNDERTFELLVRIVPDGPVSQYLGSLQPGDTVSFRGPTGRSMMPGDAESGLVLLATGVGIAPFCSLVEHLLAAGFSRPVHLYWGLRLEQDICLTGRLDELTSTHPNFGYRISLSQPPPSWDGLTGRITESVPPLLDRLGGTLFYLCGNGAMTEELGSALSDLGVFHTSIYEEPYFNRRHRPDPAVLGAIRARFVAHDLESRWMGDETELFPLEAPVGMRSRKAAERRPDDGE
ncbi:MAG TPA: FAD-binding oxidoreductase [Acidimicrobiia bacterium]|nr:FAD-binding oxidoreductase [Acidimicrobiia bacterium]